MQKNKKKIHMQKKKKEEVFGKSAHFCGSLGKLEVPRAARWPLGVFCLPLGELVTVLAARAVGVPIGKKCSV
jgi:hypothetical protein